MRRHPLDIELESAYPVILYASDFLRNLLFLEDNLRSLDGLVAVVAWDQEEVLHSPEGLEVLLQLCVRKADVYARGYYSADVVLLLGANELVFFAEQVQEEDPPEYLMPLRKHSFYGLHVTYLEVAVSRTLTVSSPFKF